MCQLVQQTAALVNGQSTQLERSLEWSVIDVDAKGTIAGIADSGLVLQTRSADEIRTSEQITGTPLLKETWRVIIVDVKDITAGIADSSLVYRPRRTGVTRSRK